MPFNAEEVLRMAVKIEKDGCDFYGKAAEKTKDASLRADFLRLAEMERAHQKRFEEMAAAVLAEHPSMMSYDPDGEAAAYIEAFVQGKVFDVPDDPAGWIAESRSPAEVFRKAIGLENESILFYTGLKGYVPPRLGRDRIDEIIREEMGHVVLLTSKLKALRR